MINHADWLENYLPIRNPGRQNSMEFGPEIAEVEHVSREKNENVWSKIWDFENEVFLLVPGFVPPDGLGDDIYFICKQAWQDPNDFVVFNEDFVD
jgi:hypothetical protein